jgi:hypothetical protein
MQSGTRRSHAVSNQQAVARLQQRERDAIDGRKGLSRAFDKGDFRTSLWVPSLYSSPNAQNALEPQSSIDLIMTCRPASALYRFDSEALKSLETTLRVYMDL